MKFQSFCFFCVEQRPLRTQSVSMWSSLQNSGRKSMRRKKRKTRLCVTPYSGWKMSSTDGGMVRNSYVILQTKAKTADTELVFRLSEVAKSTM